MNETRKLNDYRKKAGYDINFTGHGIDIGAGHDLLDKEIFTNIESIGSYDIINGKDATTCADIPDQSLDFVYSSHCLEHLEDPYFAFSNWMRICKRYGSIVFAVPHEIFYEKCMWPSRYNSDHKTSWTNEFESNLPKSININKFLSHMSNEYERTRGGLLLIKVETILLNFDFTRFMEDQTLGNAVCQIECRVQLF